ncbi:hypothetical protein J2T57_001467 [Natronocella acetinitrilica]|uniref:Uncharacterized protein n=1 Tax=Natronocella acetinitrilica TaxID=414046 RepID=A0AAE3G212_9GAMM|nr:hypothetical protein [Natronocella acetinitrilica]MCP1674365.1 hypothetical protein [Natronocella acetinitrilica]
MNTAKVYQDSAGRDCSISQMVAREPQWAASRVQAGEAALEELVRLRAATVEVADALREMIEHHLVPGSEAAALALRAAQAVVATREPPAC